MKSIIPKIITEKLTVIAQIFLTGTFFILLNACEIREIDPQTGRAILEEHTIRFSAVEFVDENWDDQVIPAVRYNSTDLHYLLALLESNPEAAAQYGHREGTRPFSYLVSGEAEIAEVDTGSRVGKLKLDSYEEYGKTVNILIGPVISGTALRDALPFITFGQFTNQLEFADVSREMHNHIQRTILSELDFEQEAGRRIQFYGAFTNTGDEINITPVILELKD